MKEINIPVLPVKKVAIKEKKKSVYPRGFLILFFIVKNNEKIDINPHDTPADEYPA
ncbi:hypothetical protein JEP22_03980 [Proteus mirabilis]|nr:hypothetical protein [Proteus mirabilis]